MARYTTAQIAAAASAAAFYVTPKGQWLRMQWTETENFVAQDEETGEDHVFEFDELVDEDVHFEQLIRVVIA